jgi:hypothetical protein
MWLSARRAIGGLLRGVLEEVTGSQKISQSLNSVIGLITASERTVCRLPKLNT